MSLEFAILGFLNYQPYTGYDLKKIFDTSIRHFWPADQSQIYRTLARLTEQGLAEMEKIENMGGAVAAIENGYMQKAIAKSAYQKQRSIDKQEEFVIGVNCYTGQNEINVKVNREVEASYDPALMKSAEKRQKEKLSSLKRERDNTTVRTLLSTLRQHAEDEAVNLMPDICKCVENDVSLQEICDVLRDVFGEFQQAKL